MSAPILSPRWIGRALWGTWPRRAAWAYVAVILAATAIVGGFRGAEPQAAPAEPGQRIATGAFDVSVEGFFTTSTAYDYLLPEDADRWVGLVATMTLTLDDWEYEGRLDWDSGYSVPDEMFVLPGDLGITSAGSPAVVVDMREGQPIFGDFSPGVPLQVALLWPSAEADAADPEPPGIDLSVSQMTSVPGRASMSLWYATGDDHRLTAPLIEAPDIEEDTW